MKTFRHIALLLAALLLASCAMDELWDGVQHDDSEEVVMTFRPKFEDFHSVTKAIGDGSKVDKLLVQVYEENSSLVFSGEYDKNEWNKIKIPFFYGKTYKVYFWAYDESGKAYTIAEGGLKNGVTVKYPAADEALGFDALEYLDAFYAVETINLSDDIEDNTAPALTRPFAQVNLVADKAELLNAKASKVVFTITAATGFIPGQPVEVPTDSKTFTFTSDDNFQSNEAFDKDNVYLGTTYLFVPSDGKLTGTLTLIDSGNKELRKSSVIEIPLAVNSRTNLVFSGIQPAQLPWDPKEQIVPDASSDGWIHISRPEQLAAFLLAGTSSETKVHICCDIDMSGMPESLEAGLEGRTFVDLVIDGGELTSCPCAETSVGGGSHMISNLTGKAFLDKVTGIQVSNLILDGFTITSSTGHVGTLINTLKGSAAFTNVVVSNSSAATDNGAAGGIVGYVERINPAERSEILDVKFDACQVSGAAGKAVASGTQAEGKFVGLLNGYDNKETLTFEDDCTVGANTAVADYVSSYTAQNQSCFLTVTDNKYDQYLGSETCRRGTVNYGAQRIVPKWDGTSVEPLLANATYDQGTAAGTNKYVVYSPFDLAGVRKKTASPSAIYLMQNVDMFGQGTDGVFNVPSNFTQSATVSADDNNFEPFNYVTTLDGLGNSIYNLSISQIQTERAAFILYAEGTTVHRNINFRNCCTVAVHKPVDTDAKSYGAILVSNVDATKYTMENVHAWDCKVFALQKVGTLGARICGTSILKDNSVNDCYVENYECNIPERFDSGWKEVLGFNARVYADFFPHGEVGGAYGFIQGNSTISNCNVNNTIVYGFGQNDKKATVEGDRLAIAGVAALGYYLVPGRHVSTFIGNIRATGSISITTCKVDSKSECTNRWDKHTWRVKTGGSWLRPTYDTYSYDYLGQAYYVEFLDSKGSVTIDGVSVTLGDCRDGTLYNTK